jgi:hypothetical protein
MTSICRTALSPMERNALISLFVCDLKLDTLNTFGDAEGATEGAPLPFKQLNDPFTQALVAAEELVVVPLV